MNIIFEDDFDIIITAIENGDVEDAIQMLREIQEESREVIKPLILN